MMHTIRVAALVQAFGEAMEFWGRGDPVPARYGKIRVWVMRRDPAAEEEAAEKVANGV